MESGRDRAACCSREVGCALPLCSAGGSGIGQEEPAVGRPELDTQDLSGGIDRPELRLEGGGACRGHATGCEIGWLEVAVDEAADGGRIGTDDRAEKRL